MSHLTAQWLSSDSLQQLFTLFENAGAVLRLVGGSVRDGLLGLPVEDIDLAVDRDPHWVLNFLTSNHIHAIPTGIDHGTITAVIDKHPYQITTLRVDVKAFGRKAEVAFTEDWIQDAKRRDFTINAIYANRTGELFDPVNGLEDLKNRKIRFIGDPNQRIQEDYLRILRFFRFSARFGDKPYNEEGLKACALYASHLPYLARERVTEEFLKILALSNPLYTLEEMEATGVLLYILHPHSQKTFKALIELEQLTNWAPSPLVRLAALRPASEEIKEHLRLSLNQQKTLSSLIKTHPLVTETSFKQQAYLLQKELAFQLAFLQTAKRIASSEISLTEASAFFCNLYKSFSSQNIPKFPLTGQDILKRNIPEGEQVGALLRQIEAWWLSQDLEPDKTACLKHLSSLL